MFSWYSLVGSLCSAVGGLTCGILLTLLMDPQGPWHLDRLQAYRVVRGQNWVDLEKGLKKGDVPVREIEKELPVMSSGEWKGGRLRVVCCGCQVMLVYAGLGGGLVLCFLALSPAVRGSQCIFHGSLFPSVVWRRKVPSCTRGHAWTCVHLVCGLCVLYICVPSTYDCDCVTVIVCDCVGGGACECGQGEPRVPIHGPAREQGNTHNECTPSSYTHMYIVSIYLYLYLRLVTKRASHGRPQPPLCPPRISFWLCLRRWCFG